MTDSETLVTVLATAGGIALVVLAAWHVWYALGLSRVLDAHGVDGWRAWVPLLGDAEVLRLGRIDPVRIALVLVPVVAVYGVVLRAVAAHRINLGFGRGAGTTVLAVLLPPVWAMVLAGAEPVGDDPAQATEAIEPDDEPFALVPATALPAVIAPTPAAAPVTTPASAASLSAPPRLADVPPSIVPGAPRIAVAPQAAPTPPASAPSVAPEGSIASALAAPEAAARSAASLPGTASEPAATEIAAEPTSLRRRSRGEPSEPGVPSEPIEPPADDETSLAAGPRDWELVLASGQVLPLTARTIVLGRKPQPRRGEAQYVTVDDETRTVSKEHAQLQWASDGWTIADLGSVNGVTLVDAAGGESKVAADAPVAVEGGFLLGDARLILRRATR